MLNKHFFNSLPLVAATLSKKLGISVRFFGDQAKVTYETRVITMPADSFFDNSEKNISLKKDLALGYIVHEAAHLTFFKEEELSAVEDLTKLERYFFGALIDGRDERLMTQKYAGAQRYLWLLAKEKLKIALDGLSNATSALSYYLLFYVRFIGQNGRHSAEVSNSRKKLLEYLPEDLIRLLELVAHEGVFAKTRFEIRDAAIKMTKLLTDYLKQQQEQQQQQQEEQDSSDSGNGEDEQPQSSSDSEAPGDEESESQEEQGSDEGSGSDDQQEDSSDSGDGEDEQPQGGSDSEAPGDEESESQEEQGSDEGSGSDDQQEDSTDSGDGEDEQSQSSSDFEDPGDEESDNSSASEHSNVISKLLEELEQIGEEDPSEIMNQEDEGQSSEIQWVQPKVFQQPFAGIPEVNKNGLKTCKLDLKSIKQQSVMLRTRIANLLQAEKMEKSMTARRGRLATNKLYKLAVNDERVFNKKQPVKSHNIAVHLLLDGSSSMDFSCFKMPDGSYRNRAAIAYPAAQAFALAVSNYPDINVGASIFCQKYVAGSDSYENLIVPILEHGQKMTPNTNWGFVPYGNTPLAEGIFYAWSELMNQPEERKILILLTDGDPDNSVTTKEMIALCKRSQIEVIGLSIGSDYLERFLDPGCYHVVNSESEIVNGYFSILQQLLATRGKR